MPLTPSIQAVAGILDQIRLPYELRSIIPRSASTPEATHALAAHGAFDNAVRVLAFALPPRTAIAWACECAKLFEPDLSPGETRALDLTKRWLTAPSDENRRAVFEAGEEVGFGTSAGCIAAAAFMCEGSIAPPSLDPVPPPAGVYAQLVSVGVILAAVRKSPELSSERFREYVDRGAKFCDVLATSNTT